MAWKKTAEQRFWEKVNKNGPVMVENLGPCWEWTGALQEKGHPQFYADGKQIGAHRFSLLLHGGSIGAGECVCHRCDHPPCVNPQHLFVGSRADNNRDRDKKQRTCRGDKMRASVPSRQGEDNGNARLTAEDVRKIRRMYATGGYTQQQLADMFGIQQVPVGLIVRRKSWSHVE